MEGKEVKEVLSENTKNEITTSFKDILQKEPDVSEAVAALRILMEFMEKDTSKTLQGLNKNLNQVIDILNKADCSVTSVNSACELFLRFITLTALDYSEFTKCKEVLSLRGSLFLKKLATSREKIAKVGEPFILDGSTILTHARSRVVYQTLLKAAKAKKRFHVYVTQSCPDKNGEELRTWLLQAGIPCTLILDSAIGYIMEKVDLVLVGAEGVVESGGIINKVGTYAIAICAKAMNKPFYVLVESFKFVRLYPLNQQDVPNEFKYSANKVHSKADLTQEHPLVDYTPPFYVTLIFSDLGILTPSAVSDELIKLYE